MAVVVMTPLIGFLYLTWFTRYSARVRFDFLVCVCVCVNAECLPSCGYSTQLVLLRSNGWSFSLSTITGGYQDHR